MQPFYASAVFIAYLTCSGTTFAADAHRVLILDSGPKNGRETATRLMIVDADTDRVIAHARSGYHPDVAISPLGNRIAILNEDINDGEKESNSRLTILRASDLGQLESEKLPFDRTTQKDWGINPLMSFSPDNQEVLVQKMLSHLTNEGPISHTFDEVMIHRVKLHGGAGGHMDFFREGVRIPRARTVVFLRINNWPTITLWNSHLGAIEVVDLKENKITSKLSMDDLSFTNNIDTNTLESENLGGMTSRLGTSRGAVIPMGDDFAVYLPKTTDPQATGFLRKIDLKAKPPKIVFQSLAPQRDLRAYNAVASEATGDIFVVKNVIRGAAQVASHTIKKFNVANMETFQEIDAGDFTIDRIDVSDDGKLIYALDRKNAKFAAVDAGDGHLIRMLSSIGERPVLIFALSSDRSRH